MIENRTVYPNLGWAQFEIFNDNKTDAFEEMCKDLFICEYLKNAKLPHADHNNPGVEVVPVLEPPRDDGQVQRYISYQAKYFKENINDSQIVHSLQEAVKHYAGKLDTIYLFCNKVISTGTDRYRKYMTILGPANIELELITDKDIFALIRKHPRVADYYFQDRKRTIASTHSLMGNVTCASGISESEAVSSTETLAVAMQEMLNETISRCKDDICNLEFGKLNSELNLLMRVGVTDGQIHFYNILLKAHNKVDFSDDIIFLPEKLKEDAYWLKNFLGNMREVKIDEYVSLSAETQIITLDCLFSSQHWDWIINLYGGREKISQEVLKAFEFHVALSQFNLSNYDKAHDILASLFSEYHEQRFYLYDICALLCIANKKYIFGNDASEKNVKNLLDKLDATKELVGDQVKTNESMIAILEMQACFNLGATEKYYLEQAYSRYEKFSAVVKSNDGVRLFSALCFEMAGDLELAFQQLSGCSWHSDEALASRYLTLLIDMSMPDEAINAFKELDVSIKTIRVEAIFLLALYRLKDAGYKDLLQKTVEGCCQSLSDLFVVGFYVEDRTAFDEIIFPKLKLLIPSNMHEIDTQQKIGLLAVLAHNSKLELMNTVLDCIQDVTIINQFVAHDIYKCLFGIANKEYEASRHERIVKNDLRIVERIADRFVEAENQVIDFIQIKLLCASANHMVFSMLKYSKELFEYTHDVQTARNIIALLCERNETKADEYSIYLKALVGADDPSISVTIAVAMVKLGRQDEADYYAYKAVYELNGEDNVDIYKSLLGYNSLSLLHRSEIETKKTISSNMIVTLDSNGEQWIVALDSEEEFGDKDNCSLGVEHIGRKDPNYVKLIGKGRGQVLNLRGKSFRVISFEPREFFLGKFIYQKVLEYRDEFKGTVEIVSTDNTDEMIKQILSLADHREQTKALINAYNFGTNYLGIPIDFFVHGDYGRYVDAQRYLLYSKGLAYYAGEPRLEFVVEAKYVPALSTLILLASKGWLDTLDWLGDQIVIPESYMSFFKEQYFLLVGSQTVSPGTLIPLEDGKYTILEPDKQIPEIWDSIINKCKNFRTEAITDEERIAYEILEGYSYERLFARMNMDKVQLDALVLAERLDGVYYCDDLFFRKIAAYKKIKNINFATLLYANDDLDVVMPILIELSKTNYVYTPVRCRNNEEGRELVENLLDGEMKNTYYSQFFNSYINVRDQIIKQYFGDRESDDNCQAGEM